ncbi:hypothetical protein BK635_15005 [Pseudomonas chlororaphis]|uniref:hypothetical protein n=1 Tax=Pseudomonas chlororaphis TaxID=587753 RepID=UPI000F46A470|nr:hypothetical protein [Pseudomonas chlororaphis]RON82164.1 hypothetical protein BK635_15005 [Pseudomonas chlororaphis]
MVRYMPITGLDCTIQALLIDTEAPLDVLHENAAYRIRCATQLLEQLATDHSLQGNAINVNELAQLLVIPLRDGCDLLDIVGRRLQAEALSK